MDELCCKILSVSRDHFSYLDTTYTYRAVNQAYLDAHNKTQEQIVSHTVSDLFGEDVFKQIIKPKLDLCLKGQDVKFQQWMELPAYGKRFLDVIFHPDISSEGKAVGVIVNARDITDLKLKENETEQALEKITSINLDLQTEISHREKIKDQLNFISTYDYLTKTPNRKTLISEVEKLISENKPDATICILDIHLNHLEKINLDYGQEAGDSVLVETSLLIQDVIESNIQFGRTSGAGFLLIVPGCDSIEQIKQFAQKIIDKIHSPLESISSLKVTSSIGVSMYPQHSESAKELILLAHRARQKAQCSGSNNYEISETD